MSSIQEPRVRPRCTVLGAAAALLLCALSLMWSASPAKADNPDSPSGYSVTFVARYCSAYTDIFANKQRNDIQESLQDLGPNTQYTDAAAVVNPDSEALAPQDTCSPLPDWQFKLGTGYQSKAVTGAWGSLSKVTDPYGTGITTQASTPLLDQDGNQVKDPAGADEQIPGAVTIQLTNEQREQANNKDSLWAQGGLPDDPVLANEFGGTYAFGALRCATDVLNGDNVEYLYFNTGVHHIFCYALYVKPAPTSGLITIKKVVTGAPAGSDPSFPFQGDLSYNPNGFTLAHDQSQDFYRAGGSGTDPVPVPWHVTEDLGEVDNYKLTSVDCTKTAADGSPGRSTTTVSGTSLTIGLIAGDHVTCTFNNAYVPPGGNFIIQKVTRGGTGSFDYTVVGEGREKHRTVTTTDQDVPAAAQSLTLGTGSYTITEHAPASDAGHWRSLGVNCNGTSKSARGPVHVDIVESQRTTCTFDDGFIPRGSISIDKITQGDTGSFSFLVAADAGPAAQYKLRATTNSVGVAAAAKPNTPADATDHLRLGRYGIAEQSPPSDPPTGWGLTTVECNGLLQPFSQGAVSVQLTKSDPNVHCVFANTFTHAPPPIPPEPLQPLTPIRPPSPAYSLSDLAVVKQASQAAIIKGQTVTYKITVRNHGPDPAQRVVLADQPLGKAGIISIHSSHGTCIHRPHLECQLGTVLTGHSVVVTVKARPTPVTARFVNRAVVGTATLERTLGNNVASVAVRVMARQKPPPIGKG